jgi:xylulokinase
MLLGIDLGTSSVKVQLVDYQGTVTAAASAPYSVNAPYPGWAESDPRDWFDAVCATVRRLVRDSASRTIDAIGLSGQMHGVVLCDAAGTATRRAIL